MCWCVKKLSAKFTKRFEGKVHQVSYLCMGEPWRTSGCFLATDKVLDHRGATTLYARGIFKGKHRLSFVSSDLLNSFEVPWEIGLGMFPQKIIWFSENDGWFLWNNRLPCFIKKTVCVQYQKITNKDWLLYWFTISERMDEKRKPAGRLGMGARGTKETDETP